MCWREPGRAGTRGAAAELCIRCGLSQRLVDDFVRPTLAVGLFTPLEQTSAAVALELLYFYAFAHQARRVAAALSSARERTPPGRRWMVA